MSFLISDAIAQTATSAQASTPPGSNLASIMMLVGFIVIFYFLLWRPQAKRAKEQRDLISSLNKGDEVITNGGIVGKITKVNDDFITLAIADNVEIKLQKSAVASILPKGTVSASSE